MKTTLIETTVDGHKFYIDAVVDTEKMTNLCSNNKFAKATNLLQNAKDTLIAIAIDFSNSVNELKKSTSADKCTIEFSCKINVNGEIIFMNSGAEAGIKVSLTYDLS